MSSNVSTEASNGDANGSLHANRGDERHDYFATDRTKQIVHGADDRSSGGADTHLRGGDKYGDDAQADNTPVQSTVEHGDQGGTHGGATSGATADTVDSDAGYPRVSTPRPSQDASFTALFGDDDDDEEARDDDDDGGSRLVQSLSNGGTDAHVDIFSSSSTASTTSNAEPKSQAASSPPPVYDPRRRVKLYELSDETSMWIDNGTGYVSLEYIASLGGMCIVVRPDNAPPDSPPLLETRVSYEDIYRRQDMTLVVWTEPFTEIDLALSFQEEAGAYELHSQLLALQARIKLPKVSLDSLGAILQDINDANTVVRREKMIITILQERYLQKLIELFHTCEDLESEEHLHLLFRIFRSLIQLNDSTLLEALFEDDLMLDVLGVLEYDPELSERQRTPHRRRLQAETVFRQVVPFSEEKVYRLIHQTFRIGYLKDVVLARSIDDSTMVTLNSQIFFNQVEIVNTLQQDKAFLTQLFALLHKRDAEPDTLLAAARLLQELCNMAKPLQIDHRHQFYHVLVKHGLFKCLDNLLAQTVLDTRLCAMDIVFGTLMHKATLLRQAILSDKPDFSLLLRLVGVLCDDSDAGMKLQVTDILKVLLDPAYVQGDLDHDELLTVFYENEQCLLRMLRSLQLSAPPDVADDNADATNEAAATTGSTARSDDEEGGVVDSIGCDLGDVQDNVCELLSTCIVCHRYRIKHFLLKHPVSKEIVKLCRSRHRHLALAAVRYVRAMLSKNDDFYTKHIIKNTLFDEVFKAFRRNGAANNLLNSAILEMFEVIRRQDMQALIRHTVDTYSDYFEGVDYCDTFKSLVARYEQLEYAAGNARGAADTPVPAAAGAGSTSVSNVSVPVTVMEREAEEARLESGDAFDSPGSLTMSAITTASGDEAMLPDIDSLPDLPMPGARRRQREEEEEQQAGLLGKPRIGSGGAPASKRMRISITSHVGAAAAASHASTESESTSGNTATDTASNSGGDGPSAENRS